MDRLESLSLFPMSSVVCDAAEIFSRGLCGARLISPSFLADRSTIPLAMGLNGSLYVSGVRVRVFKNDRLTADAQYSVLSYGNITTG
jgi:hypothetical protein